MKKILTEIELKSHIYKKVLSMLNEEDEEHIYDENSFGHKEAVSLANEILKSIKSSKARNLNGQQSLHFDKFFWDGIQSQSFRFWFAYDYGALSDFGIIAPRRQRTNKFVPQGAQKNYVYWKNTYSKDGEETSYSGEFDFDEIKPGIRKYNDKFSRQIRHTLCCPSIDKEFDEAIWNLKHCYINITNPQGEYDKIDKLEDFKLVLDDEISLREYEYKLRSTYMDEDDEKLVEIKNIILDYKKVKLIINLKLIQLKAQQEDNEKDIN